MSDNELRIDRGVLRWGLLVVGIIALIVASVAYLATPGSEIGTVTLVSLGVGILGIVGFVLIDPQSIVDAITGRSGLYALTSWVSSLLFIGGIIVLYIVLQRANITPLDLTESGEFKLSAESVQIIEELDADVEIIVFYEQAQTTQRDDAKLWLDQYVKASNGRISYEFVDPNRDPIRAQTEEVTRAGTIVFKQGNDNRAEANLADERSLTTALVQVQQGEARVIYFIVGHGERSIAAFEGTGYSQIKTTLESGNFIVNELNLLIDGGIPEDADVIVIGAPQSQFSAGEIAILAEYMDNGGSLLTMFEPELAGVSTGGTGVFGVDFDNSGDRIATAGSDGTAKIWDASTGEELLTLTGHAGDVRDVVFSPNGDEIATASSDGTVRIWDADSGEELRVLEGQTVSVRRIAYSPDGSLLASAGEDQVVNVWETGSYAPTSYSPLTSSAQLFTLEFASDGDTLAAAGARQTATGGVQGVIVVWDTSSGNELISIELHSNVILDLAFSADDDELYSVSLDGSQGTVNLEDGEGSTVSLYPDAGITAFGIADDGTWAYALGDGSVHLHEGDADDTDDDVILIGHEDIIWDLALAPDGENFVTSSGDGDARVWDRDSNILKLSAHAAADVLVAYLGEQWNIAVNNDIVIDVTGEFYELGVAGVVIDNRTSMDATSPLTQSLRTNGRNVAFITARSLTIPAEAGENVLTNIAFSSPEDSLGNIQSWGETNVTSDGVGLDEADTIGPVTVAVSGENFTSGARIVVFGDADFVSNQYVGNATFGNDEIFLNAANWLAGEEAIDGLPTVDSIGQFTMDNPLSQAGLIITSIASVCLLPLVMLVVGGVVWFSRRRRR